MEKIVVTANVATKTRTAASANVNMQLTGYAWFTAFTTTSIIKNF